MRCPYCKIPIPHYSINCPNCYRSLYDETKLPSKTLRTSKLSNLKKNAIKFWNPKTNDFSYDYGYVYDENDEFLVLLSSDVEELSWFTKLGFKVIPKEYIRERTEQQKVGN